MRTLERSGGTRTTRDADDAPSPPADTGADVVVGSASASLGEEELRRLLDAAAALDDDDHLPAIRLRSDARRTTGRLVAAGLLPAALAVEDTDPPVVVARLLGRAWRHATRSSI